MLSTLQGMIWKEYYQAEILCCVCHTCSVIVFSPGIWSLDTELKISSSKRRAMQLPPGPRHWWLSSRTLTVSAKISSEPGHSAVLCHLLRLCMTNPQMRSVTFREHCGLCQYAKQSECAWQIMKHILWKLWTLSQCQSAAENLLLLEVMLAQICC